MSSKVYIYILIDPLDNEIRYVGMTTNPKRRLYDHKYKHNESLAKVQWIEFLQEHGKEPLMDVVEECDETNWIEKEKGWIKYYTDLGCILLNRSIGGSGYSPIKYWKKAKKLDWNKVNEIRLKVSSGEFTQKEAAIHFGICYSTVNKLMTNILWRDENFVAIYSNRFHIITMDEAKEIRRLVNEQGIKRTALVKMFDSSSNIMQEIIDNKRLIDPDYTRKIWKRIRAGRFSIQEIGEIQRRRLSGEMIKDLCAFYSTDYKTIRNALGDIA